MMILLAAVYCAVIWLVFAKLKLLRLSLPIACVLASVGPIAILALLFCMQYFHPASSNLIALQSVVPITSQLTQNGRVTEILVRPNEPVQQGHALFSVDKVPYENRIAQLSASLAESKQRAIVAESNIAVIEASIRRSKSELDLAKTNRDRLARLIETKAISQREFDESDAAWEAAVAVVQQGDASLKEAQLSVKTAIAQQELVAAQLSDAKYDLEQTTVLAPSDGYVTNLQLRPGMLIGPTSGAVMTFVAERDEDNRGVVVAGFGQKNFLLIKPGQYSEVVLKDYPGQIFTGEVLNTIDVSGAGQMTVSGLLPTSLGSKEATQFAVRIKLDEGKSLRIPAGTQGQAVVYTEHVQIAGVPLMILTRMKSWLNYVW